MFKIINTLENGLDAKKKVLKIPLCKRSLGKFMTYIKKIILKLITTYSRCLMVNEYHCSKHRDD